VLCFPRGEIDQQQVGMLPCRHLLTRRADTTGIEIVIIGLFAQKCLGEGQRAVPLANARGAQEGVSLPQSASRRTGLQAADRFRVSQNIGPGHVGDQEA
jgi:hypothetical protein